MDALDAAFDVTDGGTAPEGGQGQPAVDQPSAVQPEGQGRPDAMTGLYDLSTITDPAIRSEVERIAKDIDRNANAKFQEHAEYRKSWEPYQAIKLGEDRDPINLLEYEPEGIGALLGFAEKLADDDRTVARDALLDLAASLEIDLGMEPAAGNPAADADAPLTRAEFEAWQQAQEDQRLLAQYEAEELTKLQQEFAEVQTANGKPFTAEEKQRLQDLAKRFQADHDQPIKAAWEFINSIAGQAETALIKSQPAPPARAESGGRAASTVKPVDSFEEAERLHRERNASAHS